MDDKRRTGPDSRIYQVHNGTWYHETTPLEVIRQLETLRLSRMCKPKRCRVWLRDPETGKDWSQEWDVTGYIGRSMGTIKIPLLIHNRRSYGGPGLLDDCIVKIKMEGRLVYQLSGFHQGKLELAPSDLSEYEADAKRDGEIVARFKK
jgi:hypothetical protein